MHCSNLQVNLDNLYILDKAYGKVRKIALKLAYIISPIVPIAVSDRISPLTVHSQLPPTPRSASLTFSLIVHLYRFCSLRPGTTLNDPMPASLTFSLIVHPYCYCSHRPGTSLNSPMPASLTFSLIVHPYHFCS